MPEWNINFGWTANAQSLGAAERELKASSNGFARMIINDVALAATDDAYLAARRSLVTSVKKVAMQEVSRMAMLIANTIALADNRSGPEGPMSIKAGMSETAKLLGFDATYFREDSGITWSKRRKRYLRWKKGNGYPEKWWEMTGELRRSLADADLYLNAFGPVNVLFTRVRDQSRARTGMQRSYMMSGGGPLEGQSSSANLQQAITHGGRAGRISAEFQVGKLEVITFGNITPRQLPSLRNMNSNRAVMKDAAPRDNAEGLAGMLPEGEARMKLVGRQGQRRYAVEPYVSYFLTRAIPNAVWRRTETLIASSGIRQAGKSN